MSFNNAIDANSTGIQTVSSLGVWSGSTVTQHGILLGGASNAVSSLGVASNGQLAIGSAGADPVLGTITAGSGISVTNGAGSITIAATASGFAVLEVSGSVGTLSIETEYFFTAASTATLPTAPTLGATIVAYYTGAADQLVLTAGTGDVIQIGSLASSSAGTATNVAQGACLILSYASTAKIWWARGVQGNWILA